MLALRDLTLLACSSALLVLLFMVLCRLCDKAFQEEETRCSQNYTAYVFE